MKRVAIKIGSNVLTKADGTLDYTRMSALVDQIADLHRSGVEVILISSGAVAAGRNKALADKLDAVGAMGIARTLLYQGHEGIPIYSLTEDGTVSDGTEDRQDSFFREYKFKLEKLYDRFYTQKGAELAAGRRDAARHFYEDLLREVRASADGMDALLRQLLERNV